MPETKTILVTGGAGFIGVHTAKKLLEAGHRVIIVDNFNDYYEPSLKEARINRLLEGDYRVYRLDIKNYDALGDIFQEHRIDHIIHLAAQAGVRYSMENPFLYSDSNLVGSINLFELAKKFGVKGMTVASSSSVYGNAKRYPVSEEDSTDMPISLYGATKKSLEAIAHSYHHLYNIPITCLRYFTVYGPWGRPDMAIFKFTHQVLNGETIDIYGHGQTERDFTYIDDIVDGTVKAFEKNLPWEIINLGQGNPNALMECIEFIEQCCQKEAQKKFLPMQPGDVIRTYADNSRARALLGWEPRVGLKEGIERFVKWYKEYYKI
ncbi:SDR family NAD(P)-dependent oxidoreductase [Candidatus Uhrbacteria bacterium]|nr:SDR family NAD(P)-dependent oxidoreductase [Candidatus Uhrbacteria bacterium]